MISREINPASTSTMRGHFGCIFKATADCATGVWCAFYMRILGTQQWSLCGLVGEKRIRAAIRMVMAMAMVRVYAQLGHTKRAMQGKSQTTHPGG
jgi:hypothetical protein